MLRAIAATLALCFIVAMLTGCATQRRITHTEATALQQLLTTEAVDRAVAKLIVPDLQGRTVFIQTGSPAGWGDQFYLNQAVAAQLSNHGAVVTTDPTTADYVVSVLAGSIGTDFKDVLFGMPPVTSMSSRSRFPSWRSTRRRIRRGSPSWSSSPRIRKAAGSSIARDRYTGTRTPMPGPCSSSAGTPPTPPAVTSEPRVCHTRLGVANAASVRSAICLVARFVIAITPAASAHCGQSAHALARGLL